MHRQTRRLVTWTAVAFAACMALVVEPVLGQVRGRQVSGRTSVSGTVTDPDGNGVEDVLIRLVEQNTTTKNTQVKGKKGKKAGQFNHPLVEYGDYKIYAEKEGWKVVSYEIENRASDESDAGSYGPVRFAQAQEPRTMALQASGFAILTIVMAPEDDYQRLAMEAASGGTTVASGGSEVKRKRHPAEEGRELYELKNYTAARDKFLEALELADSAKDASLQYALGRTYFQLGDYVKADEFLQATLTLTDNPPQGTYYYRALSAHEQGRTSEAIGYLDKEMEGMSDPPSSMLTTLGSLYRDTGDIDSAVKWFEKAVAKDGNNIGALLNLASVYVKKGDQDKAEGYFEQAAAAGASSGQDGATVFFNIGAVNYNQREYETAVSAFRRAIELKPKFADAHRELGYTLWDMGDRKGAAQHFQTYLDLVGDKAPDKDLINARISIASS